MKPILFQWGWVTIYTYGICVAVGYLLAVGLMTQQARRRQISEVFVQNLCLIFLIFGIVGARVLFVLLNWSDFRPDPWEIFRLTHGGLAWFGGFLGAVLAGHFYIKRCGQSVLAIMDLVAPFVALGQAVGRLGCFFNGCCHGRPSEYGIYFPVHDQVLFPSQLIDSLTLLVVFVVLRFIQDRRQPGQTIIFYLMLAGLQRFFMEMLRGDERSFYWSLSVFQWMSLVLVVVGIIASWILACRQKRS